MGGGGSSRGRGQGTFQSSCHILHYHMVLRPKGTSHNKEIQTQAQSALGPRTQHESVIPCEIQGHWVKQHTRQGTHPTRDTHRSWMPRVRVCVCVRVCVRVRAHTCVMCASVCVTSSDCVCASMFASSVCVCVCVCVLWQAMHVWTEHSPVSLSSTSKDQGTLRTPVAKSAAPPEYVSEATTLLFCTGTDGGPGGVFTHMELTHGTGGTHTWYWWYSHWYWLYSHWYWLYSHVVLVVLTQGAGSTHTGCW